MRRTLTAGRLVVATYNPGKLAEIQALLGSHGVEVVSATSLGISEPEETETTFAGNARLKADHCARASGLPALSDDSGLCVDALGGAPGVYSARWAGPDKDFALAMRNVEEKLQAKGTVTPDARKAHFICALCLAWPDGHGDVFEGRVDGILVWPPRGSKGFGYDPMFVPGGFTQTFGEMEEATKHKMSHRARAFERLVDAVF
jgi:XTP/dITP diphosphohydrolase